MGLLPHSMRKVLGLTAQMDSGAAFQRLLLVSTFLLIFLMAARSPLDSDMWWHLSAGREMLDTHSILRTDVFSFTRAGSVWVNPYWLTQAGMAALMEKTGYLGVSAAVASLALLAMVIVSFQCNAPPLLKTGALILSSVVASAIWSPRPHLVSLVLTALTGYLLYLYKWQKKDFLWGLPLVFLLWANTHPGYPLGLILIGTFIAGELANHLLAAPGEFVLPWRKIARLAGWAVVCGLVVLLNPNGIRIWLLPFQTVDMRVLQQHIPEWASPDFHDLLQQSLLWLLLICFAAIGLAGRVIDGSDLALLLVFSFMALVARRNYGPFALVAAPILCRYGGYAIQSWRARSAGLQRMMTLLEEKSSSKPVNKAMNLALVGLIGLTVIGKLYVVSYPALVNGYLAQLYPVKAVSWLGQNYPGGKLFNEYDWGGYLQWNLRKFPIFVDGRTDLFGDEIIGKWILTVQAGEGWQEVLDEYGVDLVMLQPDRPVLRELGTSGWRLVYADEQAMIYERR